MRMKLPYLLAAVLMIPPAKLGAAPPESVNLRRTIAVDVAERTKDAVVYISTRKIVSQRFNPTGNPMFDQFDFGQQRRFEAGSLGSGFIVHHAGYIVTNNHVIDRARQIEVELLDGRKLPADLISSDPEADIAILKIQTDKRLPTLELGDSSDLLVGEPVIAVGNPLGFSHSVSVGIVSALHRDLKGQNEQVLLGDLIQTDAAINPGNSGGPLLNAYGQVIGINTAIRGDAQNIGFAIQVNTLRDLIPELMNPSQATKLDLPIKLKEQRKVSAPSTVHATVVRADDNTPIESIAGAKPHDIVDAYALLLSQKENETFSIALAGGKKIELTPRNVPTPDAIVQARERLGVTVEELTPMAAQKYGMIDEEGMLITQVARD
ncbi:MAG: trypsin-like peptidase domain-containing protein, partial [Anaerolineae bacterium]|nr:trypsin-like peptidase domain-containing protein [Phycisphaerae bacterium]